MNGYFIMVYTEILAVNYFVLSQSTRLTDRQIDRKATAIPRVRIRSRTVKIVHCSLLHNFLFWYKFH